MKSIIFNPCLPYFSAVNIASTNFTGVSIATSANNVSSTEEIAAFSCSSYKSIDRGRNLSSICVAPRLSLPLFQKINAEPSVLRCGLGRCTNQEIAAIAETIRDAGGRALVVGGVVRDKLLGRESKDYDIEVYGLSLDQLESVLGGFGEVIKVGRSFGVLRVKGLDVDFSIPRRDSKTGPGHRGFQVNLDPRLSFEEASRRRDLTINSMGWDPLSGELLDPHGGIKDLEQRTLRATDSFSFSEDPLRGLRVAQFIARFEMQPDAELLALCRWLDFKDLPGERSWEEFRKMLLKGRYPSRGLEFLRQTELIRFFPELEALIHTPQDPMYHPEGTVWKHTLNVVDEAANAKTGDDTLDLIILFAALCHDVGKATTTVMENGHIRSPMHSEEGEVLTETFLGRLRASNKFITQVKALVRHHLAPTLLVTDGAKSNAYRRLARKLEEAGVDSQLLFLLARADHLGVASEDSLARRYPYGDVFLKAMSDLNVDRVAEKDVVLGRHLIARGLIPGPQFTPILQKCREIQYETGWHDPALILERALATDDTDGIDPNEDTPLPRPFLLPDVLQGDINPTMINLPPKPTENDINAIGLLLPGGFKLSFDQGKVVMTVLGGADYSIPLFTYEIAPNTKQDYEGPLLSQLLEDLAKRVANKLRNTSFDSSDPSQNFNDIHDVIGSPLHDVMSRHCPNNEFSIRVGEIFTTDVDDWKFSR
ncbi:MAG: HD domain-containing protein [Pseudomonadota bacterium]